MKLEKLVFKNIRNFNNIVEFKFDETTKLNTISGRNGSGKSTIFKSIVLCQKAFFASQIKDNSKIIDSIGLEAAKFFKNKSSFIELTFSVLE